MQTRDTNLKQARPEIPSVVIDNNMSSEERFQNLVLRPIVQLQEALLIAVFKNYINKHKRVFYELSVDKRMDYIDNAIQKDMKFRNSLKGMIIGQFTAEEYSLYIKNSSALNKRMMHLVKTRLKDNIQLFEYELAS